MGQVGATAKRRLMTALLVALLLWPGLHAVGVHLIGFNQWFHAGWAMYTAPKFDVWVVLYEGTDSGGRRVPVTTPQLRRAVGGQWLRWNAYGRWGEPEPIARAAFAAYPGLGELTVVVHWTEFDGWEGEIAIHSEEFHYRRGTLLRP